MNDEEWDARVAAATQRVEHTLNRVIGELSGSMVVKMVVAFEYITPEGERQAASLASPGLMKWDVHGLLGHIIRNDDLDSLRQLIQGEDPP